MVYTKRSSTSEKCSRNQKKQWGMDANCWTSFDRNYDYQYYHPFTTVNSQLMIDYSDFIKVEMHIGTIIEVEDFPEARKPAYKLKIDFGEKIGIKKSSAQITDYYTKTDLLNLQIIAVTNFPPKQIANIISEVLVLGSVEKDGKVVLLKPERPTPNGSKIA